MKKCYQYVWVTLVAMLCACNPGANNVPITNSNIFPEIDRVFRFAIYDNPLDSNDLVLGLAWPEDPDPSDSIILRDCFTNELISCADSMGNLKEYVVLFLGEETEWENVRLENPIYEVDGEEYYLKIYLSQSKEIDYQSQASSWVWGDTLEINLNDWKHPPHVYLENKKQKIENCRYSSYRLLQVYVH